jgi:hypothetical protein
MAIEHWLALAPDDVRMVWRGRVADERRRRRKLRLCPAEGRKLPPKTAAAVLMHLRHLQQTRRHHNLRKNPCLPDARRTKQLLLHSKSARQRLD